MRWCHVQTDEYDLQAKTYPNISTHHKLRNNNENKIPFSLEYNTQQVTEYDATNISGTQPRKTWSHLGKVDASDLMMIIILAIDVSFQSPKLKWASRTQYNPIHCNENMR